MVPGARHAVAPAELVSTGWPRVKATCANIGWRFDPWQDACGRLILGKSESGKWAADLSILSIPRQVGKSYLLGCIIFALCLLTPKMRVIWTSHHTATTEEMYEAMKELAQHKKVAPHIVKCIALQGSRWRIQFRNGSRIDFGARSQGFGRGKAKVGVLVLDEFQHITGRALANLAPTTNTAENPLILCAGTPPGPEVSGEAFRLRRKAALEGLSDDTLYVEFSADPDAETDDRKQWAKANPSFPKRTKERAFLLLRKILDAEDFRREALGIWDDSLHADSVIPEWPGLAGKIPTAPEGGALAVACDVEETRAVLCWSSSGEQPHVAVNDARPWTARNEFAAHVAEVQKRLGCPVVVRAKSTLIPALEDAGVDLTLAARDDRIQAASDFALACQRRDLRHGDYDELNAAVAAAKWRTTDGRRVLVDLIGDLEAATLALWGTSVVTHYDPLASIF